MIAGAKSELGAWLLLPVRQYCLVRTPVYSYAQYSDHHSSTSLLTISTSGTVCSTKNIRYCTIRQLVGYAYSRAALYIRQFVS